MARITIEDCIKNIPNRFELVLLAAERARRIKDGDSVTVDSKDSAPVTALKEIAAGNLDLDKLRDSYISQHRDQTLEVDDVITHDIDIQLAGDIMQKEDYDCDLNDFSIDDNLNDILTEID